MLEEYRKPLLAEGGVTEDKNAKGGNSRERKLLVNYKARGIEDTERPILGSSKSDSYQKKGITMAIT